MKQTTLEDLKYPLGHMPTPLTYSETELYEWINNIEKLPIQLRSSVQNLTPEQLDTPYRAEGWQVRQVVHHVADSHINAYMRLKCALTEDNPTIKPYEEQLWAELKDYKEPIENPLQILTNIHQKMTLILRGMSAIDFQRLWTHPSSGKTFNIGTLTAMYSWHGRHHLAHIENLKTRMKWT